MEAVVSEFASACIRLRNLGRTGSELNEKQIQPCRVVICPRNDLSHSRARRNDLSHSRARRNDLSHSRARRNNLSHSRAVKNEETAIMRAEPVNTAEVNKILESIKWDEKGLVVAIAQHLDTGAILMQGFANPDAVSATLGSGKATFFSRSRSSLWTKGETSSNFIHVMKVVFDCDRDSLIYLGIPDGPTCHTGAETCYFTQSSDLEMDKQVESATAKPVRTTLYALEEIINQRKQASSKPSWTQKLLNNQKLLCSKIREEADELCRTIEDNEGKARTVSEMADLLYHSMVLLNVQDVKFEEVLSVLRARFSQSGIEEKTSRKVKLEEKPA